MALACFACGARLASAQCSANFAVAQMRGAFGAKARNFVLGIHAHGGGFAFVWRAVGGGVVVGAVDFRHAGERHDVACDFLFGNAVKNARTMLVPRFCGGLVCGSGYVGSIEAGRVWFGGRFGCSRGRFDRVRFGRSHFGQSHAGCSRFSCARFARGRYCRAGRARFLFGLDAGIVFVRFGHQSSVFRSCALHAPSRMPSSKHFST